MHSPRAVRDMSADWVIVTSCWPIRGQCRGYRPIRGRHEASEEVIMREVTGPGAMSGLLIIILGLSLGSVRGETCHKFTDESVNLMSRQPSAASLCNVLWSSESVLTQTRKPSVMRPGGDRRVSHNTLADTQARGKWITGVRINKPHPLPESEHNSSVSSKM